MRAFRDKAIASERLQKSDLEMSDETLLDSLSLVENTGNSDSVPR